MTSNTTAQATGGYAQDAFIVAWDNKTVTCPNGATTDRWGDPLSHRGTSVVRVVPPGRLPPLLCSFQLHQLVRRQLQTDHPATPTRA
ncbi:hypothetical protein ACFU5O_20260 [Streptomyces sp. NPDC057445]|uniref:hypothetical protein n=1 Tax=Streptomyces sp. NPDC057445 TaxID=3346136 RepID=UPI0036CF749A